MAIHNRARPFGFWHTSSTVLSGEFEHLDDYAYSVSSTGGTYSMADLLTIGGTGVTITAPFNASDAKVISVDTSLTIELGATLQLTGNLIANSGAIVGITSGAFITVSSGGTFTMNAGSTANVAATTTLSGTTTISGALTCSNTVTLSKGVTITQSTANTNAVTATGNGTGAGASCTGGATGPGLTAAPGTAQTAAVPQKAAEFAGYIQLTGTDPSATVDPGANNVIHALTVPKAWALINASYTILASYNIASVTTILGSVKRLDFVRPMANTSYGVSFSVSGAPGGGGAHNSVKDVNGFQFSVFDTTDKSLGFPAGTTEVYIEVMGAQ